MDGVIRVLACTSAEAERRLRKALSGHDLTMALTFPEAMTLLNAREFHVVVVDMMFDESRALELMQLMCRSSETRKVPVVGIRGAKVARVVDPEVFDVSMIAPGRGRRHRLRLDSRYRCGKRRDRCEDPGRTKAGAGRRPLSFP